jgi:quercetin dioxygenase-like cupin family protein
MDDFNGDRRIVIAHQHDPLRRVRTSDVPMRPSSGSRWIGSGRNFLISRALGTEELEFNVLELEPGTRTRPHTHSADQLIHQLQGVGIVALAGGPDERLEKGEYVLLPAGVPHMHGAAKDGPAVFFTALRGGFDTDFECSIPPSWMRFRA